ncbi:hypothetical protein GRAN_2257 [Granulicella sibirica]|uniref:Uncharacterized protein n=1 Tax=Granulicella sibirica TaxID=2479048 RepID=A0A4Q0T696_9BACT|nr:hypothetical protein GRAN_2257 [Granulicella sibirica]
MDLQTDIDEIRAKIAALEVDRDRCTSPDVKANIQSEIERWIRIHAHVLLSTRFANPDVEGADLAPEEPVREPRSGVVRDLVTARRRFVIVFALGLMVGAAVLWLFLRAR